VNRVGLAREMRTRPEFINLPCTSHCKGRYLDTVADRSPDKTGAPACDKPAMDLPWWRWPRCGENPTQIQSLSSIQCSFRADPCQLDPSYW